ncbi:glycosyltransferase family 1 protein [Neobacillus mesonae]|uniref:glycosyltransferase family 1 protein n=1 Tax=Neobacillus mesonae TaxID=1193713 RepID=UPI00203A7C2B|nr:glycosyltransferase family 1 protein [Neobacillus mesonae]MCM3568215.1 glycosyltransferase family 1 protein [Neobacillus mesonae]
MKQQKIKRVLHIVSAMNRGGAETLIMNVYRNIDKSKIQFDFVVHHPDQGDYDEEIIKLGGKIFKIQSLGKLGPIKYIKELVKILKLHPYIAVHSHTDYQSGFPAFAAKLAGVQNRICHSHSTNWQKGTKIKDKIILKILQAIIKISATRYCSCSEEAAKFLFGKHVIENRKYIILNNGINVIEFIKVNKESKKKLLQSLNLSENKIIIGHVGTFSESKNQFFIIKVLKKLLEKDSRFVALFVGEGPLKFKIMSEAENLGIKDNIRFLGVREDIPELMNAFDIFLFPSKFEGFGIVTIEAQSAGTPCVLSQAVPKSVDMGLGLVSFVDLNRNLEVWCDAVLKNLNIGRPDKNKIVQQVKSKGFAIQENIQEWLKLYGLSAV